MKNIRKTAKVFSLLLLTSVILLYISGVIAYTFTTTCNTPVSLRVVRKQEEAPARDKQEETSGYPLFLVAVSVFAFVVIGFWLYGRHGMKGR